MSTDTPTSEGLDIFQTANRYKFSGVKAEDLGSAEYTLVTIVNDVSGSVGGFKTEMEKCLQTILEACQKSPRAENLLIRLVQFDTKVDELHGFKVLSGIDSKSYDDILVIGGATALFDATHTSIDATLKYAKGLGDVGIQANAIIFVITDGEDNSSAYTPKKVKEIVAKAQKDEVLESVTVVLIGVSGGNSSISQYLDRFKNEAGINQYVDIGSADPKTLAKLAQFISRSVSSTSQALGSGGPSAQLTF